MADITNIGENIAELRKKHSFTQEAPGEAVGVSTQAVSKWECGGTPDISLLPAIADFFGVSIDALCGHSKAVRDPAREMELAVADYISSAMGDGISAGGAFHEILRLICASVYGFFGGSGDMVDMNLGYEKALETGTKFKIPSRS